MIIFRSDISPLKLATMPTECGSNCETEGITHTLNTAELSQLIFALGGGETCNASWDRSHGLMVGGGDLGREVTTGQDHHPPCPGMKGSPSSIYGLLTNFRFLQVQIQDLIKGGPRFRGRKLPT